MIEHLRVYAMMGWRLFPVSAANKRPFKGSRGCLDATTDIGQIQKWHAMYPGCAWAVATSSERGVIDIDPRHDGPATLAKLEAEHGAVPLTPRVRSGGGGHHYYLRFPPGTDSKTIYPGIDRKAEGGYCIIPPSAIAIPEHEGRSYAWDAKPWEVATAEAPAWACVAKPKAQAEAKGVATGDTPDPWVVREDTADLMGHPGEGHGRRREVLAKLVGVHLARGDSERSIMAMAEAWAGRCTPPFTGEPEPGDHWERHTAKLIERDREKSEALGLTPHPLPPPDDGVADGDGIGPANYRTNSASADGDGVGSLVRSDADIVTDWHEVDAGDGGGVSGSDPKSAESCVFGDWPSLPPEARYGLLGDMLTAVEPETEADPAGVLLGWLACLGNAVGRGAWAEVGADIHHPGLYVGIVGRTSDAKGVSWGVAKWPFAQADAGWAGCVCNGIGSGEGLVELVCDPVMGLDKEGRAVVIQPAAEDKRALVRLPELAVCFKLQRGEKSILAEKLMEAWDGGELRIQNRRANKLSATGYSIGLVGDIQPQRLGKLLEGGAASEASNGWMNRFLWACVRSPRSIPRPKPLGHLLGPYTDRLAEAIAIGKAAGRMDRDAEADALWDAVYPELKASGDTVPHTDRAKAQVLRLSMLYALADCSRTVRRDHLAAALGVWAYCRASAAKLFGRESGAGLAAADPDPLWLQLLNLIQKAPGISRKAMHAATGNRLKAADMDEALSKLEARGMAYHTRERAEAGGRPAERWWPGQRPGGEGDGIPGDGGDGRCSADGVPGDGIAKSDGVSGGGPGGGDGISRGDGIPGPGDGIPPPPDTPPAVPRPAPANGREQCELSNYPPAGPGAVGWFDSSQAPSDREQSQPPAAGHSFDRSQSSQHAAGGKLDRVTNSGAVPKADTISKSESDGGERGGVSSSDLPAFAFAGGGGIGRMNPPRPSLWWPPTATSEAQARPTGDYGPMPEEWIQALGPPP